jgi:exoribonuclease-2
VRVRVHGVDLLTLDAHASLLACLDDTAAPAGEGGDDDSGEDADAASAAAPLALAFDLGDAPAAADAPAPDNAAGAAPDRPAAG